MPTRVLKCPAQSSADPMNLEPGAHGSPFLHFITTHTCIRRTPTRSQKNSILYSITEINNIINVLNPPIPQTDPQIIKIILALTLHSRKCIYFSKSVEQDQPDHIYNQVILCTFLCSVVNFYSRNPVLSHSTN